MEQGRLFKIVYHLLDKGRATAPELAEKFEVSVRTIYRDLDAISAAGIPVYTVQGKGGGIFILPEFVLEKSLLTPQEKEQILMALQGLAAAEDSRTDELLTKLDRGRFFRLAQKYGGCGAVRRAQKGCFQLPQGQLFVFCGRRRRHCPHGGTGQADFQEQGLVFVRLLPFAKRLPLF